MRKGNNIMKRYYIIVEGQVQGVGFRNFTQLTAIRHNCTGYVRNMENGMVEIQIQGDENNIRQVLKTLKEGNHFIQVDNVTIKEISLVASEKKFRCEY